MKLKDKQELELGDAAWTHEIKPDGWRERVRNIAALALKFAEAEQSAESNLITLDAVEKAARAAFKNTYSGVYQRVAEDIVQETLQLLAPKPKTLEDRVTVEKWVWDTDRWIVLDRGWNMSNTDGFKDKKDAEIFRLGWIEKCRREEAK
jgi:hypothetical protein